jgi:hypothetical protein
VQQVRGSGSAEFVAAALEGAEARRLRAAAVVEGRIGPGGRLKRGAVLLDQGGGAGALGGVGLVGVGEVLPCAFAAGGGEDAVLEE